MAMSATAGPRAKRARQPQQVQTKDKDPAMDVTELSQFVRDLMRQHDLDRVAWRNFEDVVNDHAKKIDVLDHEALQVTDNLSQLMDNMLVGVKNNEEKLKLQLQQNLADTTVAMQLIDTNLRKIVFDASKESTERRAEAQLIMDESKKEFDKHKADSVALIKELQEKFKKLDLIVSAAKVPFLDPTTGFVNTPPQPEFYDVSTPAKTGYGAYAAGAAGPADGLGGYGQGARAEDRPLPPPAGARAEDQLPRPGMAGATTAPDAPMRFPPGYGHADPRRDLRGPGVGVPMEGVEDKHKLRYDSKTFETKIAQEPRNHYDGGCGRLAYLGRV